LLPEERCKAAIREGERPEHTEPTTLLENHIMMRRTMSDGDRRGAIAPLTAVLLVVFLAMAAFAVDIGYLAVARTEAQNTADSAAWGPTAELAERLKNAPIVAGIPVQTADDLELVRAEAKAFALGNQIGSENADVHDADIEIGYMANPYDHSSDTLDTSGWPARPYNAVRVSVFRDESHAGGPLNLFFGPILGMNEANTSASATAVFAMGTINPRGNQGDFSGGLLPFTYQVDQWNALLVAGSAGSVSAGNGVTVTLTDNFTVDPQSNGPDGVLNGGDGKMETTMYPGKTTSGNFGTINFSKSKVGNSTNVLRDLIENGPAEGDWPDLPDILDATPANPVGVNGDPGLSAGMKPAVEAIVGQPRILPLYSTVSGQGNNTYYQLVGFTPITIVDVQFNGSKSSAITIQPAVIGQKSLIDGTNRIYFEVTPSENPNPLFLGARGLVR
jgi:hypothetical protein